jgi:hypothetical protein
MDELLYREEMMCLQRSHIAWLKEGDRNTKNIHRKKMGRGKRTALVSYRRMMEILPRIKRRWKT